MPLRKDTITPDLNRIKNGLNALPDKAYKFFRDATPVRSGNARRRTKLKGGKIVADYSYAEKLDAGYSKKAPNGMIKPTTEYLNKLVKKILKGN